MKKLLLTLTLLLTLGFAASAEVTITYSDFTISGKNATATKNDITIIGNSSTAPAISNQSLRVYANGTITVSSETNITKIVLHLNSTNYQRYTTVTPSVGTISQQNAATSAATMDENITWTGSAKSVTFTIGAKATLGTQKTSAGQLHVSSFDVTTEEAGPVTPEITAASGDTVYKANGEINKVDKGTVVEFAVTNYTGTITSTPELTFTDGKAQATINENVTYTITAGTESAVYAFEVNEAVEPQPVAPTITLTAGANNYTADANVEKGTEITISVKDYTSIYALVGEAELSEADFENGSYKFILEATTEIMVEAKNGEELTSNLDLTLTATEPLPTSNVTATYDFAKNDYGMEHKTGSDGTYETNVKVLYELGVTITPNGNFRYYEIKTETSTNKTLRIQKKNAFTISVPEGCHITKISFEKGNNDLELTADNGIYADYVWTPTANTDFKSVRFTQGDKTGVIKSIAVEYETTNNEISAYSHELTKKATVASLAYTFSAVNHKEDSQYKVTLTFTHADGTIISNDNFTHEEDVVEVVAAPARVAGTSKQYKGIVEVAGLSKATPYKVSASYAVEGSAIAPTTIHLGEVTTNTTGIEDVTVEGNEAAEYFNLQGIRVAEPQAGQVYIVRRGAKTTKELVK